MKRPHVLALLGIALVVLLAGCSTGGFTSNKEYRRVSATGAMEPTGSADPFHVIRTEQLAGIPAGSTVGLVSGTGPSAFSIFMGAALESKGLVVREMNYYNLLPPQAQYLTDPQNEFTFMNTLVEETISVIKATGEAQGEEAAVSNIDLDALLAEMYEMDDLVIEKQRTDHYLALVGSLKALIESTNVDYILVAGAPYTGLSYATKIYSTETLNLVFSNITIADEIEWRRVIPAPATGDLISYNFTNEEEPYAYWDLSYCEFLATKIEVQ